MAVVPVQFSYCDKHSKRKYFYPEDLGFECMMCDWEQRPAPARTSPELDKFAKRYGSFGVK